ncbi:hypothetical protein LTR17_010546 [Elasticomyces elasticus]|nr:hypothetical protein LTR17_010546 [Elasticomyces elasticus]
MARRKKASTSTVQPPSASEDKPFPFEKLPAELRNAVYEQYFVRDQPIEIIRRRMPYSSRNETEVGWQRPETFGLNSGIHGRSALRGFKSVTLLGPQGLSLLLSNKTTYGEALPILYGANKFLFDTTVTVIRFMEMIGKQAEHLRQVKLLFWNHKGMCAGLRSFKSAEYLRSLEVPISLNQASEVHYEMEKGIRAFVKLGKTDIQTCYQTTRFN